MSNTPDASLVEQIRRGDQTALGRLLQDQHTRIYNMVLRMVSHRDDAAEVTQEAMLKIVQHIGDFRGQADITTWMMRIAMNLSFSLLRKRRLRKTISLDAHGTATGGFDDDQLGPLRQQLRDTREPNPTWDVQQAEMMVQLHMALGRIQDDLRGVLVLRDINEMDYQQIAGVLTIPVGTVKSRLFRARLALRQEMAALDRPPRRHTTIESRHDRQTGATPDSAAHEATTPTERTDG